MSPSPSSMSWMPITWALFLTLNMATAQMTDPATLAVSMKADKNYALLPFCINQCLWDINDNDAKTFGGDLAWQMSCASPWPNGCYCRAASATFAKGFIASCATRLCTRDGGALPQDQDIASGQTVYASYCSQALGVAYTPNAVAQSSGPTSIAVAGAISISPAASRPTSTQPKRTGAANSNPSDMSSNPSSSSSSNQRPDKKIMGLSMGAFIGVVVSISCSVIGLIFGIGFKIYKHKKEEEKQTKMHEGPTGVYYTTKQ